MHTNLCKGQCASLAGKLLINEVIFINYESEHRIQDVLRYTTGTLLTSGNLLPRFLLHKNKLSTGFWPMQFRWKQIKNRFKNNFFKHTLSPVKNLKTKFPDSLFKTGKKKKPIYTAILNNIKSCACLFGDKYF